MLSLLEMSIYGGVVIAAVLGVRLLAVNRVPKMALRLLWAVAFLRLVLPVRLPSPTSVYTMAGQWTPLPIRPGLLTAEVEVSTPTAAQAVEPQAFLPLLAILWVVGFLLCVMYFLYFHLRSRQGYRVSLPVEHLFIKDWMELHRLRRPVQVRYSDQIGSPLTYGFLWPVILLPKSLDWEDEQGLSFILAHEMAHVRRFDALTKWLLAAVLCIHWFNPLVWLMYELANRDLELSCDEAVVRQYGQGSRSSYALTLVGMEERRTEFAPLASGFSKNALQERIVSIMRSHPVTGASVGLALLLVVGVAVMFATTPSPSPQTKMVVEDEKNVFAWDEHAWEYDDTYTQEQYDQVSKALLLENYEKMSIAEFNSQIYAALTQDSPGGVEKLYDLVFMDIPDSDPLASYFLNTIQPSLQEYTSRLEEVYSGKRNDPEFSAEARAILQKDVLGRSVNTEIVARYSFTYRILDQDQLTVAERDNFLQAVLQAAQDTLTLQAESGGGEQEFQAALEKSAAAFSTGKIQFTACQVEDVEVMGDY